MEYTFKQHWEFLYNKKYVEYLSNLSFEEKKQNLSEVLEGMKDALERDDLEHDHYARIVVALKGFSKKFVFVPKRYLKYEVR